jgi:hypothetical protein
MWPSLAPRRSAISFAISPYAIFLSVHCLDCIDLVIELFFCEKIWCQIHAHKLLAEFFLRLADPHGDRSFPLAASTRAISELPYHLTHAKLWKPLEETLTSLAFVRAKCTHGMTFDLLDDLHAALTCIDLPSTARSSIGGTRHSPRFCVEFIRTDVDEWRFFHFVCRFPALRFGGVARALDRAGAVLPGGSQSAGHLCAGPCGYRRRSSAGGGVGIGIVAEGFLGCCGRASVIIVGMASVAE